MDIDEKVKHPKIISTLFEYIYARMTPKVMISNCRNISHLLQTKLTHTY